jgi:hypothetical protein
VGMSLITGVVSDVAREEIKHLYEAASAILNYDLHKLCMEGPAEEINSTVRGLMLCQLLYPQTLFFTYITTLSCDTGCCK